MTERYVKSLDIKSHQLNHAAARRQAVQDIGRAFGFMASVAASIWLINHYLL